MASAEKTFFGGGFGSVNVTWNPRGSDMFVTGAIDEANFKLLIGGAPQAISNIQMNLANLMAVDYAGVDIIVDAEFFQVGEDPNVRNDDGIVAPAPGFIPVNP